MTADTTMTDVDTPKNCPWCGSSASVNQPMKDLDYWVVECTGDIDEVSGCFAESPYIAGYDTKEKAVKAWNTRPAESALAAERDELERLADAVMKAGEQLAPYAINPGTGEPLTSKAEDYLKAFSDACRAYQRKGE